MQVTIFYRKKDCLSNYNIHKIHLYILVERVLVQELILKTTEIYKSGSYRRKSKNLFALEYERKKGSKNETREKFEEIVFI